MSTQVETYIIYGVQLDLDKMETEDDEIYNNIIEPLKFPWCGKGAKNTMGILYDVMNNGYCIAGYCISVGSEWDDEMLDFTELSPHKIDDQYMEITCNWLNEKGLIRFIKSDDKVWHNKLFILSHYH